MNVVVDGLLVNYTEIGSGPTILMVHGWLDEQKTYQKLSQELSSNYRCIVLDLPNFGASQASDKVVTIQDYAVFIKNFVDKLKLKKFVYVGHSMGGQIGVYAVGKGILEPSKLILVASAGVRNDKAVKKKIMRYGSVPFKYLLPASAKNKLYRRIGSDYSHELSRVHKNIIKAVLGYDVQADAKNISVPTLLIYGEVDQQTPPAYGRLLEKSIANSQLFVVNEADHWLHQKNATQVADIMKEFMV